MLPVQHSARLDLRVLSVVLPVLCIEFSQFLIMDYEEIFSIVILGKHRNYARSLFLLLIYPNLAALRRFSPSKTNLDGGRSNPFLR